MRNLIEGKPICATGSTKLLEHGNANRADYIGSVFVTLGKWNPGTKQSERGCKTQGKRLGHIPQFKKTADFGRIS
jgi:hypothetical protein